MPPKAKFTKNEIINAGLEIVRRDGFEALTARALGAELGSSARPVFTVFESMEEVQNEVISAARSLYGAYQERGLNERNAFKGSGLGYIRFAAEQPKLFQLLFMKEAQAVPDLDNVLRQIDEYYDKIIAAVQSEYGFCHSTAKKLYLHMWIYSHGISVLLATNVCKFTENESSDMLYEVCSGLIRKYKAEGRK